MRLFLSFCGAASVPFLRSFVRSPAVIPAFYPTRHAGDVSRKIVIIGRRGLLPTAVFLCIFGRQNAPQTRRTFATYVFKPYAYVFLRSRRQCFLFVTAILIYDRLMAGLNVKLKVNMLRRRCIAQRFPGARRQPQIFRGHKPFLRFKRQTHQKSQR